MSVCFINPLELPEVARSDATAALFIVSFPSISLLNKLRQTTMCSETALSRTFALRKAFFLSETITPRNEIPGEGHRLSQRPDTRLNKERRGQNRTDA